MYPLTKPTGGLLRGKRLLDPPHVTHPPVPMPVRTVFIADLHARSSGLSIIDTVCAQVEDLKPQLILLGGDYGEGKDPTIRFFRRLGRVLPDVPKLAVVGNNDDDLFADDHAALRRFMADNGVTLLLNEMTALTIAGHRLEIAGVEDCYLGNPCAENLFSESAHVFRVLLSHAPHTFLLDQAAPDLMLCGHTHGGQCNVLGLTCYTLWRYESWLKFTHLSGVKRVGNTTVVVSNGIGVSKYALRLGARPEIHLFTPRNSERRDDP